MGLYNLPHSPQKEKSSFSFFYKKNKSKQKTNNLNLLVENAKKDFVYLFQHPRTSSIVGHPKALKVEAWLRWSGIEYFNLSNEWLLGSPEGLSPFAQFNDKYIYGSENIIKVMQKWKRENNKKQKKKKSRKTKKAEKEIKGKEIIEKNLNIATLDKKSYRNSEKIIKMAEGPLYEYLLF
uniref:Thioredoxin-like fold domain-containing protein n=1 Tax=Meloidogyne incognita TaxID=6306 RepID=A0A914N2T4_MELIC